MYEIQRNSDFQAGATLTVRVPEEDIDKKALYTILADQPDFILPFKHRAIDGQTEFTYHVGNRSKLVYLSGNRSPVEYAELWTGVLQPLLDCWDWFMSPYSFVLKPEYLYCDRDGKTICYVYVPSVKACSDYDSLKMVATEIAKQNHVTDIGLENAVVWAIQDFNPVELLQLLKPYKANAIIQTIPKQKQPDESVRHIVQQEHSGKKDPELPALSEAQQAQPVSQKKSDVIAINYPPDGKSLREKKAKRGIDASKKEPAAKQKPPSKDKGGLFKKKRQQQEIIQGAAAMPLQSASVREQPLHQINSQHIDINSQHTDNDDDFTQLDIHDYDGPRFRCIGSAEYPKAIEIIADIGGTFTIGRYDASLGVKQSHYEFDKKAKAVSRRHAAVERSANGYYVVDLGSTAGTFLNGQKLPPNAPFLLERGTRVSFGNAGADYIWEE